MLPNLSQTVCLAEQLGEASVVDYSRGVEVIYSVLYKPAQYPEGAICPVEVMFNPQSKGNQRQIWLWCHTTAVKSVWLTLCEAFKGRTTLAQPVGPLCHVLCRI